MLNESIVFLILTIFSIQDIKTKRIQTLPLLMSLIPGILLQMTGRNHTFWEVMGGIALGVMLLVIGRCTKEAVGYGDGLVFVVTGVYLGIWENFRLLLSALIIVSIFSVVQIIIRKKNAKDEIAFIPFVWIAQAIQIGGLCLATIFEQNI